MKINFNDERIINELHNITIQLCITNENMGKIALALHEKAKEDISQSELTDLRIEIQKIKDAIFEKHAVTKKEQLTRFGKSIRGRI